MNQISPALRRSLSAAISLCVASAIGAHAAEELGIPEGDVLLVVSGDIAVSNGDGIARFDLEMLSELERRTFTTSTIWTEGVQEFTGVGLDTLLERLGVESGSLSAMAINDYAVEIPVSDASADGPIIAYARNGAPMPVREKGPLWIVYPYDSNPAYQSELTYSRSIWQLDRISVAQ